MVEEKPDVLRVPKGAGEETLERLKEEDRLDPERRIEERGDHLLIPVMSGGNLEDEELGERKTKKTPYQRIREKIDLSEELKQRLPQRWERVGDVLLIKLPEELMDLREEIGRTYAEELNMKTVMLEGDIKGQMRKPDFELIYGEDTETVHLENGIQYKLDVSEQMFSSGNIDERVRMAGLDVDQEVIVDMFAGIGYFTLPMAVHGAPEKVHSLEINPDAFHYLKENTEINGVDGVVEIWQGDNRDFQMDQGADRVVMGYLHGTYQYLPKALALLDGSGVIHYHTRAADDGYPENLMEQIDDHLDVDHELLDIRRIKSYAPHVFHVVADIRVLGG